MTDDLISRSALLEDIDFDREAAKVHPQEICERFNRFCDYAEELVKDAPAVDAVEVVMCKDCKYFMEFRPEHPNVQGADGDCYIRVVCSEDHQFNAVRGCDYCSYGVKADEEVSADE